MQVVGGTIGFLYNYYIFQYAESRMKEIFIATGIIYFVGIGMMCLFVKEGDYPPITEKRKAEREWLLGIEDFLPRELFPQVLLDQVPLLNSPQPSPGSP